MSVSHSQEELLKLSKAELVSLVLSLEAKPTGVTSADHTLAVDSSRKRPFSKVSQSSALSSAASSVEWQPNEESTDTLAESSVAIGGKKWKKRRPFDIGKYEMKQVALRLSYLGANYHGFARQKTTTETVENYLFSALRRAHLVATDVGDWQYSRCGRTDKGVSAFGNVVSLRMRHRSTEVLDYGNALNRVLPTDIRVLAHAFVPDDFNARFHCRGRVYHYYFYADDMDLAAMQKAAAVFVGTHDFRHFCKTDRTKKLLNFTRAVHSVRIQKWPLSQEPTPDDGMGDGSLLTAHCSAKEISNDSGSDQLYVCIVKGSAFLWHQIRLMMHVLFEVGRGNEPHTVVSDLLDVSRYAQVPHFNMADALPLVLFHCTFDDDINALLDSNAHCRAAQTVTWSHFHSLWRRQQMHTHLLSSVLLKIPQMAANTAEGHSEFELRRGRQLHWRSPKDKKRKRIKLALPFSAS